MFGSTRTQLTHSFRHFYCGNHSDLSNILRAVFYKNHPGHGDQGWTNLSKLGPYTSIDEPLFMAMKIPASVAPVFLDEICLISLT